jgi:hypothetical protein
VRYFFLSMFLNVKLYSTSKITLSICPDILNSDASININQNSVSNQNTTPQLTQHWYLCYDGLAWHKLTPTGCETQIIPDHTLFMFHLWNYPIASEQRQEETMTIERKRKDLTFRISVTLSSLVSNLHHSNISIYNLFWSLNIISAKCCDVMKRLEMNTDNIRLQKLVAITPFTLYSPNLWASCCLLV